MKQCPVCRTTYADEMNYCLDDGNSLESINFRPSDQQSERTIKLTGGATPTQPNGGALTVNMTLPPPKRKSNFGKFLIGGSIAVLIFFGALIYGFVSTVLKISKNSNRQIYSSPTATPSSSTPVNTPLIMTTKFDGKLKVEVLDKVKDNYGDSYLKCLITNVGDQVIINPSISLDLYDNDVKTGKLSESAKLKYLKPDQTVPVWINLFGAKKFTSARYNDEKNIQVSNKNFDDLFPNLVITNAKMSIETATSSYNDRLYQDKMYVVGGIVENQIYDNISPELFILYYDDKDEIVGIGSSYPSSLKKGEKSTFEGSVSKTSTFGTPIRFEIISVNDR